MSLETRIIALVQAIGADIKSLLAWKAAPVITAGSIDGVPIGANVRSTGAFTTLSATTFTQSNRIDSNFTIPDGQNALTIGPFEVGPDVTVTGLGNATWRGL